MLILVVAYPLATGAALARQARRRASGGLYAVRFWADYSSLYQDYRPALYLWGAARELRQLVLIAVVVGLQAHPVALQMVGGWLASLLLLGGHAAAAPFRRRHLNVLQTAMLAAVSLTFYSAVLASAGGVPDGASAALQYLALAADVGVALALLALLVWRLARAARDSAPTWRAALARSGSSITGGGGGGAKAPAGGAAGAKAGGAAGAAKAAAKRGPAPSSAASSGIPAAGAGAGAAGDAMTSGGTTIGFDSLPSSSSAGDEDSAAAHASAGDSLLSGATALQSPSR